MQKIFSFGTLVLQEGPLPLSQCVYLLENNLEPLWIFQLVLLGYSLENLKADFSFSDLQFDHF